MHSPQQSFAQTHLPLLAITQGDAAGIGPEIIVKAFQNWPQEMRGCVVVGQLGVMRRAVQVVNSARQDRLDWPCAVLSSPDDVWRLPARCLPILQAQEQGFPVNGSEEFLPTWGKIDAQAGAQAAQAIEWAAQAALSGRVQAMVTAPIHKEAMHAAGVSFPGHTELLQAQAVAHAGCRMEDMPVRMMLANHELRVVLLSIHVSLSAALQAVTFENVLRTLQITHQSLQRILGRPPRIALAGVNPHAGEGGLFGREEIDILMPAMQTARAQGMEVLGPFAPDTVFMRARAVPGQEAEFDVVVAMYHDQGLIPIKLAGVGHGVNVTLGLPLIRTSPDHGTAFDLAGTARADEHSLVQAVCMARELSAQSVASRT